MFDGRVVDPRGVRFAHPERCAPFALGRLLHLKSRGLPIDTNRVRSDMRHCHCALGFGDVLDLGEARFKIQSFLRL